MSIWSDYAVGALSDWEFKQAGIRLNNEDRWEQEQQDAFWEVEREENWDDPEEEEEDAEW